MVMPNPIGLQKEVLALPDQGHFIILGTAGSGKTTMAIYRARFLAGLKNGRVLFVTFNKALVTYLQTIGKGYFDNIDVVNYHKFARGYLNSKGKMGRNCIVPAYSPRNWTKEEIVFKAIEAVKASSGYHGNLFREEESFYLEEINSIQKLGLYNLQEYLESYSKNVTENVEKQLIFDIFQQYLWFRQSIGYKYDFEDIAQFVLEELIVDSTPRRYTHVIIDEGQDLSPIMIKSLINAVPNYGSVSYFGDVAQQIYSGSFSWRDAGFRNYRKWMFEQNYRNTKEIAELALKISESTYYSDIPDMVTPKFPKAEGPKPVLIKCLNTDELDFISNSVNNFSKNETVGILVRNREQVQLVITELRNKGLFCIELSGEMNHWVEDPCIYVGTIHSAKGLEFDLVYLAFCESYNYPHEEKLKLTNSYEIACRDEVKLLYVGVTRAKRGLFITYTHELTELLPPNIDNVYQEEQI
ncbi:3'-5' exonuclease [Lysinibacillus sp. NPDC094403]|uniref:3'-5' exonuclease n=1 Tax=Lysinibacillus sp. NPDC094403 TaxID=3390581 RepID=UPI003CFBF87F